MAKMQVEIGKVHGFLTIIKELPSIRTEKCESQRMVEMQCVCGNIVYRCLRSEYGKNANCGCKKIKHNIGSVFGFLTIVKEIEPKILKDGKSRRMFELKCLCGNIVNRTTKGINNHSSCGCKNIDFVFRKHGESGTRLFHIWEGMKQRCLNENNPNYKNYGGRGIKICDRWLNSFENFMEDTKYGYSENLTLDRFPNKNGNYEPSNFRWASDKQQANNKTTNIYYEYNNGSYTLCEISTISGICQKKLWHRVRKMGMSAQQAADMGDVITLMQKCKELGLNYSSVTQRKYDKKITEEEAISHFLLKKK